MNLSYVRYTPHGIDIDRPISFTTKLVLREAEKHKVLWEKIPESNIFKLTYQGQDKFFHHQIPDSTTALGKFCCNNKNITSRLLEQANISIAKGFTIKESDPKSYQDEIFQHLKKPLVVKPLAGSWGAEVTVDIINNQQFQTALKQAFTYSSRKSQALVEEMFTGKEYRILATKEKVIGILNRIPAHVIGDGKATIKQLIKIKNSNPNRGKKIDHNTSHFKIKISKTVLINLSEQGFNPDSVPKKNKYVFLQKVSNVSQGGEAIDVTDQAHPSVKEIAIKVVNTIPGLEFTGIDLMTKDITKPQTKNSYIIVEINDSPGFDIHDYPYQGENRHAAREFLYLLFPQLQQ